MPFMIPAPHTWLEISKSALQHNIQMYKKAIGDKSLGIVVKSNAYGHGIIEIARICQESPEVEWLFTATLSEALVLRKQGITKKILVIYFIDEDPKLALHHDVALMISDHDTVRELNQLGIENNKKFAVHIKIDSGMSRFGFLPDQALSALKEALSLPGILVEGIYSHLAQAANPDQTFSKEQEQNFTKVLEELKRNNIDIPYRHLSNSAGSTALDNRYSNLVRIGLGVYGWWPSQANKDITQNQHSWFELKPVLTFKTRIIQIKDVPEGKTVGYDRTYKTTQLTKVAVLPVGYFDGYDRRLSSKGILLIRDTYAPVIGIIAMTSTLVDVTHVPQVTVGDKVILMGDYEKVTPTHLANVIGSFNAREIMTRLNPLLPRMIVE